MPADLISTKSAAKRLGFDCDHGPDGARCAFDLPLCRGCDKSFPKAKSETSDPIASAIWRSWIDGVVGLTTYPLHMRSCAFGGPGGR
jgi:hypothetical protein